VEVLGSGPMLDKPKVRFSKFLEIKRVRENQWAQGENMSSDFPPRKRVDLHQKLHIVLECCCEICVQRRAEQRAGMIDGGRFACA